MKARPVIGVTTDYSDTEERYLSTMTYAAAVEKAGGLPLLLPCAVAHALIPQYVDLLDGVLFTGGHDTNPKRRGEEGHPKAPPLDKRREHFDSALVAAVERRKMPPRVL